MSLPGEILYLGDFGGEGLLKLDIDILKKPATLLMATLVDCPFAFVAEAWSADPRFTEDSKKGMDIHELVELCIQYPRKCADMLRKTQFLLALGVDVNSWVSPFPEEAPALRPLEAMLEHHPHLLHGQPNTRNKLARLREANFSRGGCQRCS